MSQKKISGYTIYMDKLLGKGAYGAVILSLLRSIKELKTKHKTMSPSKSFKKSQVTFCSISVDSDDYMKSALFS